MRRLSRRLLFITLGLVGVLLLLGNQQPTFAAPAQQVSEPAPAAGDPVVLAAGDIAKCNLEWDSYTGYLLDVNPGTILSIGDNAYDAGTLQEFRDCYGPTWGRHFDRIYPVPGNHEYGTQGAEGYFTYFGDKATPLEPGCRRDCKGYYSFDLGAWHIVALNSEVASHAGTEQEQWLRADLAAHPAACILAFWHRPRVSSGSHGTNGPLGPWQALYDYGADIVLSGHDHDYERFGPQDPALESDPEHGIRQWVVGTGGDTHRDFRTPRPNSEVRDSETWGVLKLTLHSESYDWEFLPIPGQTFTDKGSAPCVTPKTQPFYSSPEPAPAAEVTLASASSSAATVPASGINYTIQAGDTLGTVGAAYGLDWSVLAAANGLDAYSILEIGQVIRVPGVGEDIAPLVSEVGGASTTASTAVANVAVNANPTASTGAAASAANLANAVGKYTVQAGDTLSGLAEKFGVTQAAMAAINSLDDNDFLQIGQILVIPGPTGTSARLLPTATPSATGVTTRTVTAGRTTTTTVTAPVAAIAPASAKYHTVVSGDTIISIAVDYDKDWLELLTLNGLEPDSLIQLGQKIRIE